MILIDEQQNIIDPEGFIKRFPDNQCFIEWLRGNIINDLKDLRKLFEKREMYEQADKVQSIIDEKVDRMLEGLGFTTE